MEFKPIRTKSKYKAALREIEALFDAPARLTLTVIRRLSEGLKLPANVDSGL